ncbi:glycogen debranching N-terminal domain-containing protein, partial [Streptomyces sp. NPDC056121]|uniref:glycogen debranching N-terminal domain-containing protein n=1 Tax=Streptomyces sp. NPDC056121 TaxID=3345718 RepID=UPI0035D5BCC9
MAGLSTIVSGAPSAQAVTSTVSPEIAPDRLKDPASAPSPVRNAPPPHVHAPRANAPAPRRSTELPPAHSTLICVALPSLAISSQQGQLTGDGLEGFYRAGRRVLSRCLLRVAGREPIAVQA